jgi:hypothetical protein
VRELTSHKVNGLNEAIRITVLDEPGSGGANHEYGIQIDTGNCGQNLGVIRFQKGPVAEAGYNGLSNEALLAIVEDRLKSFQAGPYACENNEWALDCVREAMHFLKERTRERVQRGVEGTSQK